MTQYQTSRPCVRPQQQILHAHNTATMLIHPGTSSSSLVLMSPLGCPSPPSSHGSCIRTTLKNVLRARACVATSLPPPLSRLLVIGTCRGLQAAELFPTLKRSRQSPRYALRLSRLGRYLRQGEECNLRAGQFFGDLCMYVSVSWAFLPRLLCLVGPLFAARALPGTWYLGSG